MPSCAADWHCHGMLQLLLRHAQFCSSCKLSNPSPLFPFFRQAIHPITCYILTLTCTWQNLPEPPVFFPFRDPILELLCSSIGICQWLSFCPGLRKLGISLMVWQSGWNSKLSWSDEFALKVSYLLLATLANTEASAVYFIKYLLQTLYNNLLNNSSLFWLLFYLESQRPPLT